MADAAKIFMTVKGVTGESTSANFKGWCMIDSFSIGGSNPISVSAGSGGMSAGTPTLSSFNIMKSTETSSTNFFQALCKGSHFDTASVVLLKSGSDANVYLQYDFTEVYIESIQWGGSGGSGGTASESLSIAYASVMVTYYTQNAQGGMSKAGQAGYNVLTQTTS